jgi:hypothetical protein
MSNMSYCRFQNTLADLRDCEEALNERGNLDDLDLSEGELKAARRLIALCGRIWGDWESEAAG